jgi:hypothetical protein
MSREHLTPNEVGALIEATKAVRPITCWPLVHGSPPRLSWRPRGVRPERSRHRSPSQLFLRLDESSRRVVARFGGSSRGNVSTTAGTSNGSDRVASGSRACRLHPKSCCGDNPCRRATAQTDSPLVTVSATIRALSSALHARRRPAPVKTSSALCSVSILSPTVKWTPQTHRTARPAKGGSATALTLQGKVGTSELGPLVVPSTLSI